MPAPFDNIVQHLFHQPSLQSVTVDELERLAGQHPYFAAAHFLLLKKMQDTAHPLFNKQLHKTTLYFNNPLWLQFLLQPETVGNGTVSAKASFISNEPAAALPVAEEMIAATSPPIIEVTADCPMEPALESHAGMMDVITAVFKEGVMDNRQQPTVVESSAIDLSNEAVPAAQLTALMQPTDASAFFARHGTENSTEAPATNKGSLAIPQAASETAETMPPATIPQENLAVLEIAENSSNEIAHDLQNAENSEEADATDMPVVEGNEPALPLLKTIIEIPAAQTDILFEPYHTVDYFASQGIKLSKIEADGKDKLGRQLKSFTEWLKTMKKLPQVSINKILAENEESKVVADAIHSLENKEVITEAMAEVFEKQGLNNKAAEVYQKLSLLNPAKSAYFAAKIDVLKH